MIATESDFRAIRETAYAYFYASSHYSAAAEVCEEYEAACDEYGIAPDYSDDTLTRLGIRLGMTAEASHNAHGGTAGEDWRRINRYAPLIARPRESTHAAILQQVNQRDDERMRDPAELAAAREYQRESLQDR